MRTAFKCCYYFNLRPDLKDVPKDFKMSNGARIVAYGPALPKWRKAGGLLASGGPFHSFLCHLTFSSRSARIQPTFSSPSYHLQPTFSSSSANEFTGSLYRYTISTQPG
jgi:hypothetical protein